MTSPIQPQSLVRHRDPVSAAMPDLLNRPGTVVRVEGDWIVVRWRGAVGESRVPVGELEPVT